MPTSSGLAPLPDAGRPGDSISCMRLIELSEAGSGSLQLEPHAARAGVDSPAARECIYEAESPAPDAVKVTLANNAFEPLTVVDHLNDQMVLVETCVHLDGALSVQERVCYQLTDQ